MKADTAENVKVVDIWELSIFWCDACGELGSNPSASLSLLTLTNRTKYIETWCNGNTSDFDSLIVGSSPAIPAKCYGFSDEYISCF